MHLPHPAAARPLILFLLLPLLAACGPAAAPEPPAPVPVYDPSVDVTPGFNEREPDTCKSAGLQTMVGQPATVLQGMALAGPLRVIAPGEVFDQEEYRSDRIDVRTDAAGTILSISCG